MKFFFFLLFFTLNLSLFGSDSSETLIKRYYYGAESKQYLVAYLEEGQWRVEIFEQKNGQLQERIFSKEFADKTQALDYINTNYLYFSAKRRPIRLADQVYTELKGVKLWEITNNWNIEWETKFSEWIVANLDSDFFKKYNIKTDCADAAVSLRWIFARINGLPAANTLGGSEVLFSNESFKQSWSNLRRDTLWYKDQLFLNALDYILDNTYTHTVLGDAFPLKISFESIIPGIFHLRIHGKSGHTRVVGRLYGEDSDGSEIPIQLYSSTTPRMIRALYVEGFLDEEQIKEPKEGGLLQFRWPEKSSGRISLKQSNTMPYYSLEQYDPDFMGDEENFAIAIYKVIVPSFRPEVAVRKGAEALKAALESRVQIVQEGFELCQREECSPGSANWEGHSTPSRDAQIGQRYTAVYNLAYSLGFSSLVNEFFANNYIVVDGVKKSLEEIMAIWTAGLFSSDPRVSVGQRWALRVSDVVENINEQSQSALKERTELISSMQREGACLRTACRVGDAAWMKYNTFVADRKIAKSFSYVSGVCAKERGQKCLELKNSLEAISTPKGNLWEILNSSVWFVSDPRSPLNQRWGEHAKKFSHAVLSLNFGTGLDVFISKYKFAIIQQKTFVNLEDGSEVANPTGVTRLLYRRDSPFVLGISDGQTQDLYYMHYQEMQWRPLGKMGDGVEISWATKENLVLRSGPDEINPSIDIFFINCEESKRDCTLSWVQTLNATKLTKALKNKVNEDLFWIVRNDDMAKELLIEFKGKEIVVTPVNFIVRDFAQDLLNFSHHYLFNLSGNDGPSILAVEKIKGNMSYPLANLSTATITDFWPNEQILTIVYPINEETVANKVLKISSEEELVFEEFLSCNTFWRIYTGPREKYLSCFDREEYSSNDEFAIRFKNGKIDYFNNAGVDVLGNYGDLMGYVKKGDSEHFYIADFDRTKEVAYDRKSEGINPILSSQILGQTERLSNLAIVSNVSDRLYFTQLVHMTDCLAGQKNASLITDSYFLTEETPSLITHSFMSDLTSQAVVDRGAIIYSKNIMLWIDD
ncbi:MAG: hypothetical protein A2504_00110 [Bdellovibrionales bacterium RIFOXYD12_FULL_39_22]|nr:MAG: hypothetical protein A2385_14915 [Bdellovibrionales bacterium RIFOXYB1_FULL_39_21]OFZ43732.1 MAG: hypothetical protein A2485_07740 [Bdellovibrionales bacterium RIFOXYC12_FULL_39_17]OFZ48097.1 MAG: hypothetical protein A2404_15750 [Bdellovibrionales bacterium RIFOXYC1_FULL_39_130]OFZ77240.1 MAG: hypothetical protein A2560_08235 [Bdellovibrionales bacterium RIFOXYD1_FULL_39_84]OFZ95700.1 MAG: hypothetical protein A2504_00110 [Bdellovibrionales bacterium RIFOXYD12_FULL_39_22]HLE11470.1 hy